MGDLGIDSGLATIEEVLVNLGKMKFSSKGSMEQVYAMDQYQS